MSRIEKTFDELRGRGERALVAYFTAGDPSLDVTERLIVEADERGADDAAEAARREDLNRLTHHRGDAGGLEGEVDARPRYPHHGLDRVLSGGIDGVGCAELLRQLKPLVDEIDSDDGGGADHPRRHDGAQANGTGAEDGQ